MTRSAAAQRVTSQGGWVLPMAVLVLGMFMSVLDISIVNVAIPAIQNDYGVTTDEIQWITTVYSLMLGVVVPASAWLGDRFGLNQAYIWSLLLFAAGSALCGLAWNLESMILFRILQAVPGGVLPVITLAMVYRVVPPEKIGVAMGMYGLGIVFAPAIGPTLGGYLVEYWDWRLIFFINVPVGIIGAVLAVLKLPRFAGAQRQRFDVWGFVTSAYGFMALLLALTEGQDWGWTSYPIMVLLVSGVLSLALFVVIELEIEHPMLDVRVFRYWPFTNSILLVTILSIGLFAILFYVPLFLQEGQGIAPLKTGLILLPEAIVMGALMPVSGWFYDKVGPRWPAAIGLAISAYGTYLLTGMNPDVTEGEIILWTCVRAVGMGMAMMAIFTVGLAVLPPDKVNVGGAFNNVAQRVSAALGLAALTAMATVLQAQSVSDRSVLMPANDPSATPEMRAMTEQGFTGMYSLYERVQVEALATSYNDVFLVTAWITAGGAFLALFMNRPPKPDAGGPTENGASQKSVSGNGVSKNGASGNGTGGAPDRDQPLAPTLPER